jgi:5-methylcytosine-specific restriction enzyme B
MDASLGELIKQDLRKGASMLSQRDLNWEMLKNPEPIFYVLARRAVSAHNDWIEGARLVRDLLPLKRESAKTFNPDGWLGKEYTDIRSGKRANSATSDRWIANVERSGTQPYKYRLLPDLFDVVEQYDFGADAMQAPEPAAGDGNARRSWLLAWNPTKWVWDDFHKQLATTEGGEPVTRRWRCANSSADVGDEAWLVRIGVEPRSICGHGHIVHGVYDAPHWDQNKAATGASAQYVDVAFDDLRNPDSDRAIKVEELARRTETAQEWTPQRSGIRIGEDAATVLRQLWNGDDVSTVLNSEQSAIQTVGGQLKAEHVRQALHRIDSEGVPPGAQSTQYDLIDGAKRYPPKYVLELAAEFATGSRLNRADFSGGEKSTAFRILRALGFHIEPKRAIQDLIARFLAQSGTGKLGVGDYQPEYRGLKIEVSFGKGNPARIPWIAFLAQGQRVSDGIYPLLLYFPGQRVIVLCYGISETHTPTLSWPRASEHKTVEEWFTARFAQAPERYGSCLVEASYQVEQDQQFDELTAQLDAMIAEYREIVGDTVPRTPLTAPVETPLDIRPDLSAAVSAFAAALRKADVSFGASHDELVLALLASLTTRPLAILTGLSGSGKTQIAIRLGEWLGQGRLHVAAVRPDWTGSEAVFGYEDGLKPSVGGRSAWAVPAILEFMLKAAQDRLHPHLLILDEMNLAHVERYFADFLSGMESRQSCLPNLVKDEDGCWRVSTMGPSRLPLPRNLWVIGTVNVDETTYMFSPKVLDRANVLEFRVSTDDLTLAAVRPNSCMPGDGALVRGLQAIATDDVYHRAEVATLGNDLVPQLRSLHRLLSRYGMEFGFRTFHDSVRFAALMHLGGVHTLATLLDRIVVQRILPRLHGARRHLEIPLLALALFTRDLPTEVEQDDKLAGVRPEVIPDGSLPKLPISYNKVVRMLRSLRANQFASFTE